ncbi:MAG: lysophospholipid acyltransferase family protein [Desulfopila sp.]|jgi:KDO2-lipid IV(A) lauroyltransferase|nr:lysophospholipid acyltransferase family protein [Desulfopila sp.]
MKKIRYLAEYLFLVLFGKIVRLLPRKVMLSIGARAGDFIYYCAPVRKKLTLEQIRRAFPEKNSREISAIAREAYGNLAINSLEHLCLPALTKDDLLNIVTFKNEEVFQNALQKGRGVIFVGGHFGNWEYPGPAASAKGYPIAYVVADIGNPYIDKMVNRHRKQTGITVLTKRMSIRTMLKTLRQNNAMAMLMDQDAGRNGIFVDFFGMPCSTPRGPALFALKTGAIILFVSSIRHPDGSLQVIFEEVETDCDAGITSENIREVTQRCTSKLEAYVRKYPGQWFWMHRRWKTAPEDSSEKQE